MTSADDAPGEPDEVSQRNGGSGAAGDEPRDRSATPRKHLPVWQETILLVVVALGLAIVIKAVLLQAFYIPSESMEPGLVN
ncbi:MAG: S26 family signal peptidase, partial [Nocardioidaceae bacterium]|nr:S26 family signal peptidase [Nocardioidaceae bacterium]